MKIALIADELTSTSLEEETSIKHITASNYKSILTSWQPDFLFVESAWHGYESKWKYQIASYKYRPWRNNNKLKQVVLYAKKRQIPTVFWNKEDGVHFNRFIDSAKLFDHIFTVDANCIPKYRAHVNNKTSINTLMFAVQSTIHNFTGFNFKYNSANFVGSYSHHIHNKRRIWQNIFFTSASESNLGLTIFDRNSDRKSKNYRYPKFKNMQIKSSVPYKDTAKVYKDYLVSLNVNTIEDSKTMFSRRLIEILACGGIAITNTSPAVEKYFKDYCYVISNKKEALELFNRLKNGPTNYDLARARAASEYILKEHTWTHRLKEISLVLGLRK